MFKVVPIIHKDISAFQINELSQSVTTVMDEGDGGRVYLQLFNGVDSDTRKSKKVTVYQNMEKVNKKNRKGTKENRRSF